MSLPRFFLDEQVVGMETESVFPLRLSDDDARHARALRLKAGEHIAVVDAARDYFECEVVSFGEGALLARIARRLDAPDAGPRVMLVQGLAKGDKVDEVVRHATELGVAAFVPLRCERSVLKLDGKRARSRTERWRAIAKSAAMQSGQPAVPEVSEPVGLEEACAMVSGATAVLVCWEEAPGTASLPAALERGLAECACPAEDARIAVVVGPEGGLSPREVERLLSCNPRASLVSLGPSILRTETAGVVAPALVLYELGGLGRLSPRAEGAAAGSARDAAQPFARGCEGARP